MAIKFLRISVNSWDLPALFGDSWLTGTAPFITNLSPSFNACAYLIQGDLPLRFNTLFGEKCITSLREG